MNRLERISAILIKLQSGRIVTANEIAHQFGISLRTVYRDIKTLEETGIPLYGNPGIGFSLVEGYRLPPLSFTHEEAAAFLTAGKFIHKMTDSRNIYHFNTGLDKIRAVMRLAEKEFLEGIENNITVVGNYESSIRMPADSTRIILESITLRKAIEISYTNKEKIKSVRKVEPVGCLYNNPNWHLIAWCNLSNNYRNFRIDRISGITSTDEPFSRKHPTLKKYIQKHRQSGELYTIILKVNRVDYSLFEDHKYPYGFESSSEYAEYIETCYRIYDLNHFKRWFRSVEDIATIASIT